MSLAKRIAQSLQILPMNISKRIAQDLTPETSKPDGFQQESIEELVNQIADLSIRLMGVIQRNVPIQKGLAPRLKQIRREFEDLVKRYGG